MKLILTLFLAMTASAFAQSTNLVVTNITSAASVAATDKVLGVVDGTKTRLISIQQVVNSASIPGGNIAAQTIRSNAIEAATWQLMTNGGGSATSLSSPFTIGGATVTKTGGQIDFGDLDIHSDTLSADVVTAPSIVGTFTGNGSGLTNLNAANLTGTVALAALPGAVLTNNDTRSVTVSALTANGVSGTGFHLSAAGGGGIVYNSTAPNAICFYSAAGTMRAVLSSGTFLSRAKLGYNSSNPTAAPMWALGGSDGCLRVENGGGGLTNIQVGGLLADSIAMTNATGTNFLGGQTTVSNLTATGTLAGNGAGLTNVNVTNLVQAVQVANTNELWATGSDDATVNGKYQWSGGAYTNTKAMFYYNGDYTCSNSTAPAAFVGSAFASASGIAYSQLDDGTHDAPTTKWGTNMVTSAASIAVLTGDGSGLSGVSAASLFPALSNQLAIVTPEQFGATGDGVTDDAAAVQAAMDYSVASDRGYVVFCHPKVHYQCSTTLYIRGPVRMIGVCEPLLEWSGGGKTFSFGVGVTGFENQSSTKSLHGAAFRNLGIFGTGTGNMAFKFLSGTGGSDYAGQYIHFQNLWIQGFDIGISSKTIDGILIDRCNIEANKCVVDADARNGMDQGCAIRQLQGRNTSSAEPAVVIGHGSWVLESLDINPTLTNAICVAVTNAAVVSIRGCNFENTNVKLHIDNSQVSVENCTATITTGYRPGIVVTNGGKVFLPSGAQFSTDANGCVVGIWDTSRAASIWSVKGTNCTTEAFFECSIQTSP